MTVHFTTPSLLAVAFGIVGSSWTSGAIASFSFGGSQSARAVPQTTAQVWRELFRRGSSLMPKIAVVVGAAHAYAAYDMRGLNGNWIGFVAAAAATVAIGPYTIVAMKPINDKLHKAANKETSYSQADLSALVDKWEVLNYVRASLPLLGAIFGGLTFLQNLN